MAGWTKPPGVGLPGLRGRGLTCPAGRLPTPAIRPSVRVDPPVRLRTAGRPAPWWGTASGGCPGGGGGGGGGRRRCRGGFGFDDELCGIKRVDL